MPQASMLSLIRRLLPQRQPDPAPQGRERLVAQQWPSAVYAIGDIHGCLPELQRIEQMILEDAAGVTGEIWLVYLGDYVDRGANSAGVIDHLLSPPPAGTRRICLAGNHEELMLAYCRNPVAGAQWLKLGAAETLQSYGVPMAGFATASVQARLGRLRSHIPFGHLEFLESLPVALSLPGVVLVHAGMKPDVPLDQQSDDILQWMRYEPASTAPWPEHLLVVHGHTPAAEPYISPGRICIDTGAYATGRLTAIRLVPGEVPHLLTATAHGPAE
ncbi:Serine/threonine protein phosphatase I [Devosia sp. LC5]|nr:Serine/threonine protein phosphatase I [Devosia sp. LC5]